MWFAGMCFDYFKCTSWNSLLQAVSIRSSDSLEKRPINPNTNLIIPMGNDSMDTVEVNKNTLLATFFVHMFQIKNRPTGKILVKKNNSDDNSINSVCL